HTDNANGNGREGIDLETARQQEVWQADDDRPRQQDRMEGGLQYESAQTHSGTRSACSSKVVKFPLTAKARGVQQVQHGESRTIERYSRHRLEPSGGRPVVHDAAWRYGRRRVEDRKAGSR